MESSPPLPSLGKTDISLTDHKTENEQLEHRGKSQKSTHLAEFAFQGA